MACQPAGPPAPEASDMLACTNDLRMNDMQAIGSHNSYKQYIPKAELDQIAMFAPDVAAALDYGHIPLSAQLDLGMRQLELDIYHDPDGGRYADPLLPRMTGGEGLDLAALQAPGFKVLHVQDVDARSSCTLFQDCLGEIRDWSLAHPDHAPLLVLVNAKQDAIEVPGSTEPLPFDAAAFDALDKDVLSVFAMDEFSGNESVLLVPDNVRAGLPTLREGVLEFGWPDIETARGRVLIALDEAPDVVRTYMRGGNSLEGLPLFVNSIAMDAPHAAYFTRNDPVGDIEDIQALVRQGFLVRTRADADTAEARSNETARREAALESGAQYVSTDYYQARSEFSDYQVSLPGEAPVRCNPLRRENGCDICVQ